MTLYRIVSYPKIILDIPNQTQVGSFIQYHIDFEGIVRDMELAEIVNNLRAIAIQSMRRQAFDSGLNNEVLRLMSSQGIETDLIT
jgi:hypothetical protein